jgi:hypothetical protein
MWREWESGRNSPHPFTPSYHVRLNSYDKIKVGSLKIRFDIVSDLPDMISPPPHKGRFFTFGLR